MYLRILKKDLKHKRAMNVILLVFIILASMFVSSCNLLKYLSQTRLVSGLSGDVVG